MISRSSCADCEVRERSLCAPLDERALGELTSIGQRRHIRRGETLFWAGDAATICGNVLSGALQLTALTHDGREQAVATLYPADFIGRPYAEETVFTVKALADSEICSFPRVPFERMLESHVALERRVMAEAFRKLDDARSQLLTVTRQTAAEKVAGFLIDMAGRDEIKSSRATPDGPVTFELPFKRGQIADVLGLTIETVSRQLTRLKIAGIIGLPSIRGVTIRDEAALRAWAG